VADFDVWHNARAVLDNGTVLEIDNLHTIEGITHISRGLANMQEEGFAGMSGFPPAEPHTYLAAKIVSGAGVFTWENGNSDELEVALSMGQSFELCSAKSFDADTTAATGTVTDTGLDVAMDAGRGVKLEYMILCQVPEPCVDCGPCDEIDFPEGCQHFSFDYLGESEESSLILIIDASNFQEGNYMTVVAPDGEVYTVPSSDLLMFSGDTHSGSYCAYSSDENGVPQSQSWSGLNLIAEVVAESLITNLDLSEVSIVGVDPNAEQLSITGALFLTAPDYRYMTGLQGMSFTDCSFLSLPVTTGMSWLVQYVIQRCGIAIAPSFVGLPNITSLDLSSNNLPVSEVNRVLQEASANFTSNYGSIGIAAQTPSAPPSGAGLTAKAELEGRSPGWTVTVDP
jgi:hypothetical protein